MSNRIEIGDKVCVVWQGDSHIDGIVSYMPTQVADVWIIETDSAIHYVQNFETIWKGKINDNIEGMK